MQKHKVLIIGSGAREHALWIAIKKSSLVSEVLCTPGNGGIPFGSRRGVKESDIPGIAKLVKREGITFVVVGPEAPLVGGIANVLRAIGCKVFGPGKIQARLEGSKIYTKEVCQEFYIPTARWCSTNLFEEARVIITRWDGMPVVKADGLCGGKGVLVPSSKSEAIDYAYDLLEKKVHGEAGKKIVIENKLVGRECSVMAICDGMSSVVLPAARDYKRQLNGDLGPNTGGMGSYSPLADLSDALVAEIKERVIDPTLHAISVRYECGYHGLLYAGIMVTADGPHLLEYNVRFGDPETQVVLPRITSDVFEYMLAATERDGLKKLPPIEVDPRAAVCIVLASDGYPGKYETGKPITGLDDVGDCMVFHAGTKEVDGEIVTSGGRVMSVVGVGDDVTLAREKAMRAADRISFDNKYCRSDIALSV